MSDITINIDGHKYDLDDFELGELEWLEDYIGKPLSDAGALSSMKTAVGFVYIVKHREDPDFTVDQARKIKLAAIEGDDEPVKPKRPTRAAG